MPCAFPGQLAEGHTACRALQHWLWSPGCPCEVCFPEAIMPGEVVQALFSTIPTIPKDPASGHTCRAQDTSLEDLGIPTPGHVRAPNGARCHSAPPTEPEPKEMVLSQHKSRSVCHSMKASQSRPFFSLLLQETISTLLISVSASGQWG